MKRLSCDVCGKAIKRDYHYYPIFMFRGKEWYVHVDVEMYNDGSKDGYGGSITMHSELCRKCAAAIVRESLQHLKES